MLRIVTILVCLFNLGHLADHETFKDCARTNFCTTLRGKAPEERYIVNLTSFAPDPAAGLFSLELLDQSGGDNLNVAITTLEDNTFRVQVKEVGSSRYELQDVLDGEPQVVPIDEVTNSDTSITVVAGEANAVIQLSPFSIEFYLNNNLQLVFDANRLNFDQTLDQAFTFGISFPEASQLYGIHEHADSLALQTTQVGGTDPYRLRNLDVAGYELNSPMALYGSIPVLYGHGPNATSGVFLHNAAQHWYEITNSDQSEAYVMVESGSLDVFVLLGPTPTEVVRQYVGLTGTAHMPQLWTLGYHQSRWNYVSQEDVKDVVANFTTYNFPLDVIWLDIEYTNGKKYFTWDSNTFGDPVEMQQNISAAYKRLVTIVDPHIKVEQGYNVYDGALQYGLFVNRSDGSVFEGDCWPGLSSYMDFLNPAARDYYGNFYSYENFPSTTPVLAGIWNDMNEPSVFDNSIEKTIPNDALHHGGVLHRDIHNIYGLLHTMSTHQGLINRDNGTNRPFVLTRAHFAGTQRYSAIWTGDNTADWGYLSVSYSECLNANILGIVFCGADIGGFSNNPTVELLQRWYQAGAWLPFYRAHSDNNSQRREPYLFEDGVQEVIRNAIELRYKHLPVWYTLFYEHTINRDPIVRPLFYHYPADRNVFRVDDHLLLGKDILVRAVAEPGVTSVHVYFPGGTEETWFSISSTDVYQGTGFIDIPVDIQEIPVYYRKGSVIVRKDTVRLSSNEMAVDGHTLYANLDADNKATGTVYLDDNTSFNYANNKEYNYLQIDVDDGNVTLTKLHEDAVSDAFDFVIDSVVINRVVKKPQDGKAGQSASKIYKKNINGELLRNLRFKTGKTAKFVLF